MQTFLPSKNFDTAASMLDSKRLNKQILEGYQILKVLSNKDPFAAWRNHPAVKMWRNHEHILYVYVLSMVAEAKKRGIKTDTNMNNLNILRGKFAAEWGFEMPDWYLNERTMKKVTTTHRARLYVKDSDFYAQFSYATEDNNNTPCCETCSYYWPTHMSDRKLASVA